jgi:hypothetical protein
MDQTARETIVIVHGTFAGHKPGVCQWYQLTEGMPAPDGFIAKLNDALQKRGSAARCWAHCEKGDQGFHWSGKNNWVERTRAAAELGNYVLNLRKEGWCCHIVAHSHGGNVVLEALPQIADALPSGASLGKIVTLGTPFMDTMSPILQRIERNKILSKRLSWIALVWLLLSPAIQWVLEKAFASAGLTLDSQSLITITMATFLVPATVFALLFFRRKSQNAKPIAAQLQPKFLAISSPSDEPWMLLNHMRTYPNPLAVQTNLIRYLISSMQTHASLSRQMARIYQRKSYRDLRWVGKLVLALTHLWCLAGLSALLSIFFIIIPDAIFYGISGMEKELITLLVAVLVGGSVWVLVCTRIFGPAFYSAFFAPFRWCGYRLSIKGIFKEIATFFVRRRSWSVVLEKAMGLEGYRHSLPRIEQKPSNVPFVTYENMSTVVQERALAAQQDWIVRRFRDVSQTFSKMVITAADIDSLLRIVEADLSLVHAAYYTEDECIARIAAWIAGREHDLPPPARLTE